MGVFCLTQTRQTLTGLLIGTSNAHTQGWDPSATGPRRSRQKAALCRGKHRLVSDLHVAPGFAQPVQGLQINDYPARAFGFVGQLGVPCVFSPGECERTGSAMDVRLRTTSICHRQCKDQAADLVDQTT